MQAGVVLVLVVGWSLILAQPFFSARKRKDYLRSIVAFRRQLIALETGLQGGPIRTSYQRTARPQPISVPRYRRRQRTLGSLALSLLVGLVLTLVAPPVGIVLTTISVLSIASFLTLVRTHRAAQRVHPRSISQRDALHANRPASERAIA